MSDILSQDELDALLSQVQAGDDEDDVEGEPASVGGTLSQGDLDALLTQSADVGLARASAVSPAAQIAGDDLLDQDALDSLLASSDRGAEGSATRPAASPAASLDEPVGGVDAVGGGALFDQDQLDAMFAQARGSSELGMGEDDERPGGDLPSRNALDALLDAGGDDEAAPSPSVGDDVLDQSQLDDLLAGMGGVSGGGPASTPSPTSGEREGILDQDQLDALFAGTGTDAPATNAEAAPIGGSGELFEQDQIDALMAGSGGRTAPAVVDAASSDDGGGLLDQDQLDSILASAGVGAPSPEDGGAERLDQDALDALVAGAGLDGAESVSNAAPRSAPADAPAGNLLDQDQLDALFARSGPEPSLGPEAEIAASDGGNLLDQNQVNALFDTQRDVGPSPSSPAPASSELEPIDPSGQLSQSALEALIEANNAVRRPLTPRRPPPSDLGAAGAGGELLSQSDLDALIGGGSAPSARTAAAPTTEPASATEEPHLGRPVASRSEPSAPAPRSESAAPAPRQRDAHANLGLILSIPIDVSVELGRARMSVFDLLQLGQGSVIELPRLASDLIDLTVNEKVMAKGEVVVVNENFGMRVLEVDSVRDRIRNL